MTRTRYPQAAAGACSTLATLLLLVLSSNAVAEQRTTDDPAAWLARMASAFEALSYDGTFSYFDGNGLTSMRVVHKVIDGVQRERLVHLDGDYREFLREGDAVACVLMPGDELVSLGANMPTGPFARAFVRDYDRLNDAYRVRLAGTDRVAGRAAVRLDIEPVDGHRYGYRLWLDDATGLLLRSELRAGNGQALEILQFSQLRTGDEVRDVDLRSKQPAGAVVSHLTFAAEQAETGEQGSRWRSGWLPPGFMMASADVRRTSNDRAAVETLMYSDGLAAFSVYVEPMPAGGAKPMQSGSGATIAVTESITSAAGPQLVTVVGEIPLATARRIARSVQPDH